MSTPPFLLQPKNQRFLDGKDRVPWSAWPARSKFWSLLILTILSLASIAGVLLYFQHDMKIAAYLKAHGTPTSAVVLESHGDPDYGQITFRYVARARDGNEQRTITCTQNTRPRTASSHLKGARMEVIYDPANPELVRIVDELMIEPHPEFPGDKDFLGLKLISAFLGFLALMSFTAWLGELLPTLRLRRDPGQLLAGEVVECKGATDDCDVYYVHIYFRFQTPAGQSLAGWTGTVRRDDLAGKPLPPPGTPVHIFYLDEKCYWCL